MTTGTTGMDAGMVVPQKPAAEKPDKFNIDTISESPYVLGMRKQEGYKILDIVLPATWELPKRFFDDSGVNVNVKEDGSAPMGDTGYIFFSETKGFSVIYGKLLEVVTHNVELEEKLLLFNVLQKQLQDSLDNLSLSEFKQVRLIMPTKSKPPADAVRP